ncbi:AI-2E family transporter (plasmid) [Polymorphobacter sp. PAMC 29334]|uniref:AI-2E family transporter n=1 Tax=Polymorphobacter sp. PAMC 29334 TaxID=2862331 RepID=UPI001C788E11|nr:AI-2E family transporter [Polymorphobacter sp. PAMC 29334]QYE33035.1 AI-2E family transporter [Polymorphobacter sp. PAMC 29334]
MPTPASPVPALPPVEPPASPDVAKALTTFVLSVTILYFGKEVLVPVTLALLLAFVLAPLVNLLRRLHLGRVPAALLAATLALGLVLAIGTVIGTQIAQLTTDLPSYAATVESKVNRVKAYTLGRVSELTDKIGSQTKAPAPTVTSTSAGASTTAPVAAPTETTGYTPLDLVRRYLSPVLSPLATFGVVFIVAIFALLQREDLRDRMIRLAGSNDLHGTTVAIDDGAQRLRRYFLTQLSINALFGVVIGIGLLVIGVPNPVLWGILSALLRFVPYVGSLIAAVLPVTLAAAVEPGWSMSLWTLALYVIVEGVTGQAIEPMVYGRSTGLSPFSVVVAAIFWSWLWGPIGLILSTPLTLCLVVVGRHVRRLEFLDVLLGDQPALTPVESFYQRILAGDADEVRDQAERLLKDRSLSSYYDDVALKGLQLAAIDAQRGNLRPDQLFHIQSTIIAVVDDLEGFPDRQPPATVPERSVVSPPAEASISVAADTLRIEDLHAETLPSAWRQEGAVLCVAGRGPLDEAAAAMLKQLLDKHGIGARVVPYAAVAREAIRSFTAGDARMICISYLELSGEPSHLRYLIERLHQRMPGLQVVVGMWPEGETILKDTVMRRSIGANDYTSTLGAAVAACFAAARATAVPSLSGGV